jgi:hypothetical protein
MLRKEVPDSKQEPNNKHQITNKDQTEKQQKFQTNSKKQPKRFGHECSARVPPAPDSGHGRLELGFLVLGPCLSFGACYLVL